MKFHSDDKQKLENMRRIYQQFNYKRTVSKELRILASEGLKAHDPTVVPVVIKFFGEPSDIPRQMHYHDFHMTIRKTRLVRHIVDIIRYRLDLVMCDNFDICTGKGWPTNSVMTMEALYDNYREDDGMLYIAIAREKFYTSANPYTPLFNDDED